MTRGRTSAARGSRDACCGIDGKLAPALDCNCCVENCPEDALVRAAVR